MALKGIAVKKFALFNDSQWLGNQDGVLSCPGCRVLIFASFLGDGHRNLHFIVPHEKTSPNITYMSN